MPNQTSQLPINKDFTVGVDVGGTKVHIADTLNSSVLRYSTDDFPDLPSLLDDYFLRMEAKPAAMVIAMAGPRNDETGEVKLTNHPWPTFYPIEASKKYGISINSTNDMVATAAGVLAESSMDLKTLKPGKIISTGSKLIISLSTGVGVAAAVWDEHCKRYVIMPTEGGHIGIQPKNEQEFEYLQFLHKKYPHPSAELALSGKFGLENLIEYALDESQAPTLAQALHKARQQKDPVGAVLFEFSTHGSGADQEVATKILTHLGTMLGSVIRDLSVAYKATGGVYITGSVALALGEYFVTNTEFIDRFVREGAVHDAWIKNIPINLVIDPNIAVMGSLELARDQTKQ